MSNKRDYYEVLGIERNSSKDEIKNKYRKLALQFHPDRNKDPTAEGKFKEISEAYAVLSDEEKRNRYDKYGHVGTDEAFRGSEANFEEVFKDIGFGGFRDIFEQFIGGGGFSSTARGDPFGFGFNFGGRTRKGQDILYDLDVSLEDVVKGKREEIEVPVTETCHVCKGTGAAQGTKIRKCGTCDGQGQTRRVYSENRFSTFVTLETCKVCNGQGRIIEKPCGVCRASGKVNATRKLFIDVPPGVDEGMTLQMNGGGLASEGGQHGDLLLHIHVKPHDLYQRLEGGHLLYNLKIRYTDVILGTEARVPTLYGEEKLKIAHGTQLDSLFRIKGKGLPNYGNRSRGDLVVKMSIGIPTKLSERQKWLMEELQKSNI
ncbi:MAG: molecular chaperone DnaJ [Thermoproteota archaeon]|nr:molecular chaperone DnaJ [Thermoproteota archaeon]